MPTKAKPNTSLRKYRKMRDFSKSSEPKGEGDPRVARAYSFVVQEHHASHLHYDFRLEWNGVLKSWAVPKGPSKKAGVKRLAVEVEDHPLEYGKFEGTIPEDQYGAGTVKIWDHGIWKPISDDVDQALKKGHLDFSLQGDKLTGNWSLIRFQPKSGSSKQPQWLLFYKGKTKAVAASKKKALPSKA